MKMGRVLVFGMMVFLGSCSYPTTRMVHPVTGDVHTCKPTHPGRSGSAARGEKLNRRSIMEMCVQQFEALGYKKAEDLTLEELERLTPKEKPN